MEFYLKLFNTLGIIISALALRNGMHMLIFNKELYFKAALCQSFFIFDIINILIGKVNAPLIMTILQISSRLFISWIICYKTESLSIFLSGLMFIIWFLTDIIRYFYYLFRFKFLMKLRYSLFIILYPLGTLLEVRGIVNLLGIIKNMLLYYLLLIILIFYIPGFFFLYYYMFKQREKIKQKND